MARSGAGKSAGRAALVGVLSALSLVFLYASALVPTGQMGVVAVAGLLVAAAVVSGGLSAGFLCYGATGLLGLLLLPDKANAYPAQLSGGQKQRIAIARALATDPKVLLCDEATSALDPNTTHSILTLIKDINRKLGITVVVITHQMSVVEEICDHVAILDGGVVVEQGEVKEIFANPKTAAAKRLVAPNGGSAARDLSSFAPDDHVVRVTFNGSSAAKPLVASLAAEKGILVSVLSADTRDLSGQCYGSMLLKLPADLDEAKQAAAYMRAQPGITVEEVTGE